MMLWTRCVRSVLRSSGGATRYRRQEVLRPTPALLCSLRLLRTSPATPSEALAPPPSEALAPPPSEALAPPPLDGAPKRYAPKIQQLVSDIAGLTLLEVSDLNDLLKKTLNIQDVAMMPMGGVAGAASAAPAAEEEDDLPVKKEKTMFTVKLTELTAVDKVKLIKAVKSCMEGLNLVQAKKMVESLPQDMRVNVSKEEAEKVKATLEAAGGTVVLE